MTGDLSHDHVTVAPTQGVPVGLAGPQALLPNTGPCVRPLTVVIEPGAGVPGPVRRCPCRPCR